MRADLQRKYLCPLLDNRWSVSSLAISQSEIISQELYRSQRTPTQLFQARCFAFVRLYLVVTDSQSATPTDTLVRRIPLLDLAAVSSRSCIISPLLAWIDIQCKEYSHRM